MRIRQTHPMGFRSGEWAEVLSVAFHPTTGRECYIVIFPDGTVDWWPSGDLPADYEFDNAGPEGLTYDEAHLIINSFDVLGSLTTGGDYFAATSEEKLARGLVEKCERAISKKLGI